MARLQSDIKQIGGYQYNSRHCLGEGAFGKVYEGWHTTRGEKVAIKKIDMSLFQRDAYL
jgi:calcium-dependent protein kinase